jgi:hypothetical protein
MDELEPFHVDPEIIALLQDIDDEDLCSFSELQEDSANDQQIELYIYTSFLIFTRKREVEYLERAMQRTEGWIAVTAVGHPDRARRFQILDMMSARMIQFRQTLEEVEPQILGNR